MPWWGWVVTGALLLGAELFGVSAEFYLVFLGVAAIIVGILLSLGVHLPEWAQWAVFAALALTSMLVFRKRLYRRYREPSEFVEGVLVMGDHIVVPQRLEPEESCRVEYKGTTWTARNVDSVALEAGVEAEICGTTGFTLRVRNRAAAAS